MNRVRQILVFLAIFIGLFPLEKGVFAQGEANWWFFGDNAGVHFLNGVNPVSVTTGVLNTLEGCASISDFNGNLLFYTDGVSVFNANHTGMTNGTGLLGNTSTSQSAIIVPHPGISGRYYIFTAPSVPSIGLNYSEVDMNLSAGQGSVLASSKNIRCGNVNPADRMTAVQHANGRDYWVVVQNNSNWDIVAFLVTPTGVSTNPVISNVSIPSGGVPNLTHGGCMKISPNGKKLAVALGGRYTANNNGTVLLFDFDATTGQASNQLEILLSPFQAPYGVEFSPSSRYLYVDASTLYQYDVSLPNSNIGGSQAILHSQAFFSALQLGPDGKIYQTRPNSNFLNVINTPDNGAPNSNFQANAVSLGPTMGPYFAKIGLPAFVTSFFYQVRLNVSNPCYPSPVVVSFTEPVNVDSVLIDFGDTASGVMNYSRNLLDSHRYSKEGQYVITAYTWYSRSGRLIKDTLRDTIQVIPPPNVSLGGDTIICQGDSIEAKILNGVNSYQLIWPDSSGTNKFKVDTAGIYWVAAYNRCGVDIDTVTVDSTYLTNLYLGNDTVICDGDSIVLRANGYMSTNQWHDSSTLDSFVVKTLTKSSNDLYIAVVNSVCGSWSDTINVEILSAPLIDLGSDTVVCIQNSPVFLNATHSRSTYRWKNGSASSWHYVFNSDTVWVEVSNLCGFASDTIVVEYDSPINLNLGNDTTICSGTPLVVRSNEPARSHLWSTGDTGSSILVSKAGLKWLRVENSCGIYTDTVKVSVENAPLIALPEDTVICSGKRVMLEALPCWNCSFSWSSGATDSAIVVDKQGLYWVVGSNICGSSADSVNIKIDSILAIDLGPDTILCDSQKLTLKLDLPNSPKFQWSTGNTDNFITLNTSGRYQVTVSNSCGSFTDDIAISYNSTPQLRIGGEMVLCDGASKKIDAQVDEQLYRGTSYTWSDGLEGSPIRWLTNQDTAVWVEASNHCGVDRDSIRLNVRPFPDKLLGNDTLLCDEETFLLEVEGDYLYYEWQDKSTDDTYLVKEAGEYYVDIMDIYGCEWRSQIKVEWCEPRIWIPNAFSPNLDGENEGFRAYSEYIYDYQMVIFDRWGKELFRTGDIKESWDGRDSRSGEKVSQGVYVYKVSYRRKDNQLRIKTGSVTLLR